MVTVARDGGSLTPLSLPRRDMVPRCCENGRPVVADPHTGQTICSCQYGTGLLAYPRVPSLGDAVYGTSAAYAAAAAQSYVPLGADGSAFYSPLTSPPYDGAKEAVEGWRHLAHSGGMYFPYDTSMAAYSYGAGFGPMDLNAARRKNATKEATNTLKAWLYEHRKNPYPTKGEKIMLAIITKMTLTQVSTWFANARRRLKKENKMTWSPRNRSDDDDGDDFDDIGEDDKEGDDKDKMTSSTSDRVESLSSPGSPISARIVESSKPDSAEANELGDGHITVDDDLPPSPPPSKRRRTDSFLNSDSDDQQEGESSLPDLGVPGCKDVATRYSPSAGEICSSRLSLDKLSSSSKKSEDGEANGESSPRPKIWSVSQFLPTNSDNHRSRESAVTSSLSLSTSHPYHMTSPSTHRGHATSAAQLHPFLTSAGTHGSYGSPMSYVTHPLPITLGSSALPFPYSLSSVKPSSIGPSTTMSRQEALLATAAAVRSRTDISHGARDLSLTRPTNSLEKGDNSPAS